MLSRVVLFLLAVILNLLHFFIPAKVINYTFNPLYGFISLLTFAAIVNFTSSLKKDSFYILCLVMSFVVQASSFYLNGGGVPDYINLYFFNSNIPDFIISITILTWWYKRVYNQSKFSPAEN